MTKKKFAKQVAICLTEELKEKAYKIGGRNISNGIRIALREFNQDKGKQNETNDTKTS